MAEKSEQSLQKGLGWLTGLIDKVLLFYSCSYADLQIFMYEMQPIFIQS
jgi:hypothetical protein